MALFSSPPQSICILRLSAIGDACNAIAAVQAIARQWPETKLTWIAGCGGSATALSVIAQRRSHRF